MLPENRLAVLLEQVKQGQIDSCLWHTNPASPSLYSDHACDRNLFPRETVLQLTDQPGEVWGIQFSHNGRRLAGFGNEDTVTIWDVPSFDVVRTLGDHIEGVANIAWSPDDSLMVTCSRDKYARLWNVTVSRLPSPPFRLPLSESRNLTDIPTRPDNYSGSSRSSGNP